ncbi:MAG: hypothetical protein ACRDE7_11760, partial [Sphingobacterium sp.]
FNFRNLMEEDTYNDLSRLMNFRPFIFVVIGLSFISIISSSYFASLGQKSKAIFDILIPATALEKFLSAIFYTVIVSTVSYLLIYFIMDFGFVSYLRSNFTATTSHFSPELNKEIIVDNLNYYFLTPWPKQLYWFLFLPFLLSAIFLVGSIAFNNFHFIKTAITVVIYGLILVFAIVKIMIWMTRDTIVTNRNLFFNDEINVIKVFCAVGIIVTILLWGIAYLKLKEKEV